MKAAITSLLSLFSIVVFSQGLFKAEPYLGLGLNTNNFIQEGSLAIFSETPYISHTLVFPTVEAGLSFEKLNSELEMTYSYSFVPGADSIYDLLYSRSLLTIGYNYVFKNFSIGVFYGVQNNKQPIRAFQRFGQRNVTSGLGFEASVDLSANELSIRREFFYQIFESYSHFNLDLKQYWNFRITHNFLHRPEEQEGNRQFELGLLIGSMASKNVSQKYYPQMGSIKPYSLLGLNFEYTPWSAALYAYRGAWFQFSTNLFNFNNSAQYNALGLSKSLNFLSLPRLSVGIQHAWLLDRSLLFLDVKERGLQSDNVNYLVKNKAFGFRFSYEFAEDWSIFGSLDYYYKSDKRLGRGFNDESLKIGLVHSLN